VPFKAAPRYATFRGFDDATTPLPAKITITRGDGGPLDLEIVKTGKAGIDAELREVEPGTRYELTVNLSPPQKTGRLRSWVRLKTGVKEMPQTTIPVWAEIPGGWDDDSLALLVP
jgi:hypothetical protein